LKESKRDGLVRNQNDHRESISTNYRTSAAEEPIPKQAQKECSVKARERKISDTL
jgi:hypothetical protein